MAFLTTTPQEDIQQAAQDMAAKASQVGWILIIGIVITLLILGTRK